MSTLPNYDTNRDSDPALMILKGGIGAGEVDTTKQQTSMSVSSPLSAFLLDCASDGSACTTIDSATLNQADWSGGSTTWVSKTLDSGP